MDATGGVQTVELAIGGMSCDGCVDRVRQALTAVPGLERVEVGIGTVSLDYYPEAVTVGVVREAIEELGFAVPLDAASRNPFRRFLERMIESNERIFGNARLDCCTRKLK
jgi:copper chaperone CopZ